MDVVYVEVEIKFFVLVVFWVVLVVELGGCGMM